MKLGLTNPFGKISSEFRHFRSYPFNMRTLLVTNMIYAFVLPVVELFVGTYIMRNSSELAYVIGYQLAVYTGIPLTFLINGFLLRVIPIKYLYSFGMLLSGISMAVMMSLKTLGLSGIISAGLIMGLSYGFFWAGKFLQHDRRSGGSIRHRVLSWGIRKPWLVCREHKLGLQNRHLDRVPADHGLISGDLPRRFHQPQKGKFPASPL